MKWSREQGGNYDQFDIQSVMIMGHCQIRRNIML